MNNIFYVYEHWRPDTGQCFYVGKGKDNRAWDMKRMRNRHHLAVTAKLQRGGLEAEVRIVAEKMEEREALDLEIRRIAAYGMETLTNLTRGGDGLVDPSPEVRAKISAAQKKRFAVPGAREALSQQRTGRVTSAATKKKLAETSRSHKHTPETIAKMRIAAKARGVSDETRRAQIAALTGRKRAPFMPETIERMKAAAARREADKHQRRQA